MSEWISVEDRLPQEDFEVLVCSGDDVMVSSLRTGYVQGEYWFDAEPDYNINITHWQPLPEPPQEEE